MKPATHTEDEAVAILLGGGVGIFATDTVYGLAALANNPAATARLYALKHRERKPGTLIAADVPQLIALGLSERDLRTVEHLWPNPLSLIIGAGDDLFYLHQGLDSLPVRVPKDERLRALLARTGPLVTSSANDPGAPTATNLKEAYDYFGDRVDFYVDGGDLSGRAPSTIVRVTGGRIEVLRPGALQV